MATIPQDLYRACRAKAWGKKQPQRSSNFGDNEGAGSLYPDYEGFQRADGSIRPPDVTTFTAGGVTWVRGVNERDSQNKPYISWKEGVSVSGSPGCFGYGSWFYFLLPEGTAIPGSLDVKHTPSTKDQTHHSIRCRNSMTIDAYQGALDTLARAAIAKAVERARNSLYFSA
jgi:hypothetical protein